MRTYVVYYVTNTIKKKTFIHINNKMSSRQNSLYLEYLKNMLSTITYGYNIFNVCTKSNANNLNTDYWYRSHITEL